MLTEIAQVLFWLSLCCYIYILLGHNVLLVILSVFISKPVKRKPITPHVCFVIPAYNEERDIEAKLHNTLALDYPKENLEIIIVSDCSTDGTDEIVKKYCRKYRTIRLMRQEPRQGRTNAINLAIGNTKTDVFVVSDANNYLPSEALKELVKPFADPSIGSVTARFIGLESTSNPAEKGLSKYWKYENTLRFWESKIGSVPFISGSLNAFKGNFKVQVSPDITHDHFVPAYYANIGLRSIYNESAIVYEHASKTALKEAEIRGRNFLMGINFLRDLPKVLSFCKSPWFSVNLLFRKILRWFSPVFLLLSLISTIILLPRIESLVFLFSFTSGLIITFLMTLIRKPPRIISTIGFFCLSQLGLAWGIIQFIFGKRIITWEPPR